jgi:hypothetical protein
LHFGILSERLKARRFRQPTAAMACAMEMVALFLASPPRGGPWWPGAEVAALVACCRDAYTPGVRLLLTGMRDRNNVTMRNAMEKLEARLRVLMQPFAERVWYQGQRLRGWISDERGDVADEEDRAFVIAYDDALWEIENCGAALVERQAVLQRVNTRLVDCINEARWWRLPRAARTLPWVLNRLYEESRI